jgi:predicted nucleic acid-binding protein
MLQFQVEWEKMLVNRSKPAILDTGFLFALFDAHDPYNEEAVANSQLVNNLPVIIPWPCLYETINTRFVGKSIQLNKFEVFLKRPFIKIEDDNEYREMAKDITFEWGRRRYRTISLVDMVIRLMLDNDHLHIGYFFTFNPKDFVDVCRNKKIILPCQERKY